MALDSPAVVPEISGPKFNIITKALSGGPDADGKRRFRATASSTIVDHDGDEITLPALEKMAQKFRQGVTIFMDHDFKHVDSAYGLTDGAEIIQRSVDEKGVPVWDLDISGVVNTPNPRAVQLADSIDGGFVKLGTSITARVRKHNRSKAGGMQVHDLDVIEASIVGVPSNQRSWAHKAATAIKSYGADKEAIMADDEDETEVQKGDLSAGARNKLPDTSFACPEERKYPINDAAHVRAALSRIADPSNDQCGRDKIIAAARKFGIGEHAQKALDSVTGAALQKQGLCPDCKHDAGCDCTTCDCAATIHKALSTDDLLVKWAATEFPADQITKDDDGEEVIISKQDGTDEAEAASESTGDDAEAHEVSAESEGVQESTEETPETAPADETETDTPTTEKALSHSPDDVAELVKQVGVLVEEIGRLRGVIAEKDAQIETQVQSQKVEAEVDLAKQVIEKVMAQPLRARTAGYVEEFTKAHPLFAPEVQDFLNKRSQLSER